MDFDQGVEEHFTSVGGEASLLQNQADPDDPFAAPGQSLAHYPAANAQLITAPDMQHSLPCQRRNQKLIPFVSSLAENFEFWLEKDSLWHPDSSRVLLSRMLEERDIHDGIYNGHIASLAVGFSGGDRRAITVEYFGGKLIASLFDLERYDGLAVPEEGGKTTFRALESAS
ncbi:hypothetical protein HOY82DRAFT_604033 [Tuber indicum]|nr:hypothetical protein HOY82DRAFT_604033 [Tuber indicum]